MELLVPCLGAEEAAPPAVAAAPTVREPYDTLDPVEHRQSSLRTQIPMTSPNVNKTVAMIAQANITVESVIVIPASSLHLPRFQ